MVVHNDDYEIMFNKLQVALAKLDAAFPAGDYHLSERQNLALNEILDVSFEMAQKMPRYKKERDAARVEADEERRAAAEKLKRHKIFKFHCCAKN